MRYILLKQILFFAFLIVAPDYGICQSATLTAKIIDQKTNSRVGLASKRTDVDFHEKSHKLKKRKKHFKLRERLRQKIWTWLQGPTKSNLSTEMVFGVGCNVGKQAQFSWKHVLAAKFILEVGLKQL